ncbi:MAG TPA: hypothetical protein VJY35_08165 [Candidatus Eisenbacteria bacterium]|nr:hypothetical protein [Candidatus Eisenbacteria bacterium]
MTTKAKWLVGVAAVVAAGVAVIGWFALEGVPAVHLHLPKYSLEQADSAHRWYRRTTVHFGSAVYLNDFEDYPIWLANPVPTHAIGRAPFGNSLVCSIPGQEPTDYIAVDCGSEMEAYAVFRNANHSSFDWRHARFQAMDYAGTMMQADHKRTVDSTLIADVVRTLREDAPVSLSLPASVNSTNLARLNLYSDALPGLMFCPAIYRDSAGPVYLAESFAVEYSNRTEKIHAQWIPASESFTQWLRTQ